MKSTRSVVVAAVLWLVVLCGLFVSPAKAANPFDTPADTSLATNTIVSWDLRWARVIREGAGDVPCDSIANLITKFVEFDRWDGDSARYFVNATYRALEKPEMYFTPQCAEKLIKASRYFHLIVQNAGPGYEQSRMRQRLLAHGGEEAILRWREIHKETSVNADGNLELPPGDPSLPVPVSSRNPAIPPALNNQVRNLMMKVLFLASPEPDPHSIWEPPRFESVLADALRAAGQSVPLSNTFSPLAVPEADLKNSTLIDSFKDPTQENNLSEFFSSNRLVAPFTIQELLYELPLLTNFWFTSVLLHYPTGLSAWRSFHALRQHMQDASKLGALDEHMNFIYFCVSYIDLGQDRFVKRQINAILQDYIRTTGRPSTKVPYYPYRRIMGATTIDEALPYPNDPNESASYSKSLDPRLIGKRIAVPCQFWFRRHSIYRTFVRYARALVRMGFKLQLLVIGKKHDDLGIDGPDQDLFEDGVHYFDDPSDLEKAHAIEQMLVANPVDAIFYPEVGMSWTTTYLANLRLAPVQFTVQGHSVSTFGSKIDFYFSGDETEPLIHQIAAREFSEMLVLLPGMGVVNRSPGYLYRPRWRTQPVSLVTSLKQFAKYVGPESPGSPYPTCAARALGIVLNHASHKINHEFLCHVARALPRIFSKDVIEVKFFPGFFTKLERLAFEAGVKSTLEDCYVREGLNILAAELGLSIQGVFTGDIHDLALDMRSHALMQGRSTATAAAYPRVAEIDAHVDEHEGGETFTSHYPTGSEEEAKLHEREFVASVVWGMPEARRRYTERAKRVDSILTQELANSFTPDPEQHPLTHRILKIWQHQNDQLKALNSSLKNPVDVADLLRTDFRKRVEVIVFPQLKYEQYLGELSAHVETGAERAGCYSQIAVESFPFGGCNTVVDSVWAGVLVVTFEGRRYNARVGTAILRRISPALARALGTRNKRVFVNKIVELAENDAMRREIERIIRGARLEPIFGAETGTFYDDDLVHPNQVLLANGSAITETPDLMPKSVYFTGTSEGDFIPWRRAQHPQLEHCPISIAHEMQKANSGDLYDPTFESFAQAEASAADELASLETEEALHTRLHQSEDENYGPVREDPFDVLHTATRYPLSEPALSAPVIEANESRSACGSNHDRTIGSAMSSAEPEIPRASAGDRESEAPLTGAAAVLNKVHVQELAGSNDPFADFDDDDNDFASTGPSAGESATRTFDSDAANATQSNVSSMGTFTKTVPTVSALSETERYLYPKSHSAYVAVLRTQWLRKRARYALQRLERVQLVQHAAHVRERQQGLRQLPITPAPPPDCAYPFQSMAYGADLGPIDLIVKDQGKSKIPPLWLYRRGAWPEARAVSGQHPPFHVTVGAEDDERWTLRQEFNIQPEDSHRLVMPISLTEALSAGPTSPIGMLPDGTLYRTRNDTRRATPMLREEDYFALAVRHIIDYNEPLQRIVINAYRVQVPPPVLDWAKFATGESRSNPQLGTMFVPSDEVPASPVLGGSSRDEL